MVRRDHQRRCTLCEWFGIDRAPVYEGVAPDGMLHGLCQLHFEHYASRYRNIVPVSTSRKLTGNRTRSLVKGLKG